MLIGRRAIDKTRPSQEYNLVEWARPLLHHNKKLFKILDPRLEGQYSSKTVVKVASLAYQCLSQNPKGRPVMSQVVEILEALQVPQGKDWNCLYKIFGVKEILLICMTQSWKILCPVSILVPCLAPVYSFATDDAWRILLWWFFLLMTGVSMILFILWIIFDVKIDW